jgi:hypothetical protein
MHVGTGGNCLLKKRWSAILSTVQFKHPSLPIHYHRRENKKCQLTLRRMKGVASVAA